MSMPSTSSSGSAQQAAGPLILAIFSETPLHPGTGQSTGVIDLPIQRERHTQFPTLPATGIKGSLRQEAEARWPNDLVHSLFGPDSRQNDLYAGALAITDARLLAFPVRSLARVFTWITCPLVLSRLTRDIRIATGQTVQELASAAVDQGHIKLSERADDIVVLEDVSFQAVQDNQVRSIAEKLSTFLPQGGAHETYRAKFSRDFGIVSDEDFSFLVKNSTQVTARIVLDDNRKTSNNLWYEETIPPDTLFYTLVRPEHPRSANGPIRSSQDVRSRLAEIVGGGPSFIQIGGNETVGQGWCGVQIIEGW